MIRRYTRAEYVARAARLRAARPGLTLSTDVVVGFPGETEEDFLETLSVVREAEFTSLFGFTFSPRPHTPALRLVDDVPEQVKSERLARLFEVSEAQGRAHLASLVGTRQRVLIEGESPVRESVPLVTGRTERNEIVHLEAPEGRSSIGRLVDVEIARANKHSLAGRWTEEALAALPTAVVRPARRVLPLAPAPFSTRHA
jgi:tRNA-2-methylthio-N6-dimethylallyladenosine synthase